jgi:hypothetical protein
MLSSLIEIRCNFLNRYTAMLYSRLLLFSEDSLDFFDRGESRHSRQGEFKEDDVGTVISNTAGRLEAIPCFTHDFQIRVRGED